MSVPINEFTKGNFEFDANASVVVITAAAQAKAGTMGTTAGASAGPATGSQVSNQVSKRIWPSSFKQKGD
jgi:hypothetical protein